MCRVDSHACGCRVGLWSVVSVFLCADLLVRVPCGFARLRVCSHALLCCIRRFSTRSILCFTTSCFRCYLLPITYFMLPTYILPTSCYLLPICILIPTYYLLHALGAICILLPTTYILPTALVAVAYYQLHTTYYLHTTFMFTYYLLPALLTCSH